MGVEMRPPAPAERSKPEQAGGIRVLERTARFGRRLKAAGRRRPENETEWCLTAGDVRERAADIPASLYSEAEQFPVALAGGNADA
ncbi:MAG: hypothetical protein CSA76_00400, partial [Spirochaetales bacterium]